MRRKTLYRFFGIPLILFMLLSPYHVWSGLVEVAGILFMWAGFIDERVLPSTPWWIRKRLRKTMTEVCKTVAMWDPGVQPIYDFFHKEGARVYLSFSEPLCTVVIQYSGLLSRRYHVFVTHSIRTSKPLLNELTTKNMNELDELIYKQIAYISSV